MALGVRFGALPGPVGGKVRKDGADELLPYEDEHPLVTTGQWRDAFEGVTHDGDPKRVRDLWGGPMAPW